MLLSCHTVLIFLIPRLAARQPPAASPCGLTSKGSLGHIEKGSRDALRLGARGKGGRRNRQTSWYYFRVDSAAKELTLDIVDL
jgi:hypothetical protein